MNKNPMKVPFNLGTVIGGSIPIIVGLIILCYWMLQPSEARPAFHRLWFQVVAMVSVVFSMAGSVFYADMQKQKKKRLEKQQNIQ